MKTLKRIYSFIKSKIIKKKIYSFNINYHAKKNTLCEIGRKYDTDKSSQRDNVTDIRHCHPYTLFYNSIFKNYRNEPLRIAELGILDGASLLMWREYFPNAKIDGFEYDPLYINAFKEKCPDIPIYPFNVRSQESINAALGDKMYDLIIEDTTHQFEDQIAVIENIYKNLKPGGMLIIEDIFKRYNEQDYIDRLAPLLNQFSDYYFVTLDHENRNSTGWDNDKLFVLIKSGAESIFKNKNKLTIITPSYRTQNLIKIKDSINFDYVEEWIIVYDGTKIPTGFSFFNHPKIKEYVFSGPGISGNAQRNFALDSIQQENTMLYFLDDDNIMHPDLIKFMDICENKTMYTFDQTNRLLGNNIALHRIDTACLLIDFSLCKDIRWIPTLYEADGHFIIDCYERNKSSHCYIHNELCYYNKLST
jgi:predicted O-methyltransferase YrrM